MEKLLEAWRGLPELTRGRIITLAGVFCICFDSPTYRLLRLQLPTGTEAFGLAVAGWRGLVTAAFVSFYLLATCGPAGAVAQVRAIGTKNLLLGSALLTATNTAFTTALARTTAANVLVILAAGPLVTATICRFVLGRRLPAHTLAACACAFAAVALCFGGSVSAADGLAGCALALLAVVATSAYWTLSEYLGGDVSLLPCTVLGGAQTCILTAIALGEDLRGARPADGADFAGVVLSQVVSAMAILLLTVGSAVTPPAEVALMLLLETALAPFLVYAVVGEKPSVPTAVAGALIIATLAAHAVYDAKRGGGAGGEGGKAHGFEAIGDGDSDAGDEGTELIAAGRRGGGGAGEKRGHDWGDEEAASAGRWGGDAEGDTTAHHRGALGAGAQPPHRPGGSTTVAEGGAPRRG